MLQPRWLVAYQRLPSSRINPGPRHAAAVARYHTRMYTQCPDCLTVFELDIATLTSAHGRVCCGYCSAEFDALRSLSSNLPDHDSEGLPPHLRQATPPRLLKGIQPPPLQRDPDSPSTEMTLSEQPVQQLETAVPLLLTDPNTTDRSASAPATVRIELQSPSIADGTDVELPSSSVVDIPDFVQTRQHSGRWWLSSLLLAVVLLGQIAYAERAMLVRNNRSRGWVKRVYQIIGKPLPLVRDPAMLQLLDRDIRPHPHGTGALLISANLRNRAPFPQPYPVVEVILSNLEGQRIAMRRFRPSVYVPNRTQRLLGLPAGSTAAISFEVVDPGQKAVAFEIHLQ